MNYIAGIPTSEWHNLTTLEWVHGCGNPSTGVLTADLAFYVPIPVRHRSIVRKLWIASGSTGTGNVDLGLYDSGGVRLVSTGATAKTTDIAELIIDVTDTTIGPGFYYFAAVAHTGTDTFYRNANWAVPGPAAHGVLTEVGAYPLPATATWAADNTNVAWPLGGILLTTVLS